jgi:hypothetical protein
MVLRDLGAQAEENHPRSEVLQARGEGGDELSAALAEYALRLANYIVDRHGTSRRKSLFFVVFLGG